MNTNNLPPLPEQPHSYTFEGRGITSPLPLYSATQMREYGQLCRQPLLDTIEQQRKLLGMVESAMMTGNYLTLEEGVLVAAIKSHLRQQEGETK